MKLSNIFKKSTTSSPKSKIEKIEKNQLEKVVGGADVVTTAPIENRQYAPLLIKK